MTATIEDRDLGWRAIFRELRELAASHVDVGVIGADTAKTYTDEDGGVATLIDVATWNEYGAGNVPERSFIRDTATLKGDAILRVAVDHFGAVAEGRETAKDALGFVGMFAQGVIQQRIADGIPPPNDPMTIERKGSAKPLVHTGQLRSSITYEVRR